MQNGYYNLRANKMKLPWFKRNGIIFLPISLMGWLLVLGGISVAVYTFIAIDSKSHSASDTLRPFFFNLLIIFTVYSIVGYLTQRKFTDKIAK